MRQMWTMGCALAVVWAGAMPAAGQSVAERERELERLRRSIESRSEMLRRSRPDVESVEARLRAVEAELAAEANRLDLNALRARRLADRGVATKRAAELATREAREAQLATRAALAQQEVELATRAARVQREGQVARGALIGERDVERRARLAEIEMERFRRDAERRTQLAEVEIALRTREVEQEARRHANAARVWGQVQSRRDLERDLATEQRLRIPEAWLPQDPADSLYRAARSRLNARAYADAARGFSTIRSDYPRSGYVPDAYYFEALARSRMGARNELRRALELLSVQRVDHPEAASIEDARALAVRIEAQLARRGDAQAAEALIGAARGVGTIATGQGRVAAGRPVYASGRATALGARRGSLNTEGSLSSQAACDEEDQALRATALSALLQMDEERARPILMEVLRTRDECTAHLRSQAVFILANDLDEDADPATIELLLDLAVNDPDPDPEVRQAAVFWLAQTGSDRAVDALITLLNSDSATPEMAEQAMFALGQTESPRAVEVMRELALDPTADRELRANAIFWLTQMGETSGPFLRSLYDTLDDPELKERIFFSIAETGDEDTLDWLTARALDPSESVEVRTMALFWAAEVGLSPRQALEIYRTSDDPELREQAIFVLTQVADDEEAVEALMEIARSEEDREVRQRAIFWLGESDDPRVAEFLLEIIRGGGGA